MDEFAATPKVPPDFRSARLMGILNVVFATEILLCGLCLGGYVAMVPLFTRAFGQIQRQTEAKIEAARKAELQALEEEEKQARTEAEKAAVAEHRKEIEARPKFNFVAQSMDWSMGMSDPASLGWAWAEVLTGVTLNVMLLASGVGLMHWRPWARSLGVWTAALKILRLVVLYSGFIVVIVPAMSQRLGDMVGAMVEQQQKAMGRQTGPVSGQMFVQVYVVTYSLMGVGAIVCGSVYPAVVVWVLTRPGVKSACSGAFRLPREPNQPC